MDAASVEEANKLRVQLGMKPLPVPGAAQPDSDDEASAEEADYLQARVEESGENFRRVQEKEEAKRRRDQRAETIKKAREKAQRDAVMEGKGLGEGGDEVDAKTWLAGQKKRQKQIAKLRKLEEEQAAAEAQATAALEYTSKDLAGVKVAHDASTFMDGDDQILTLKDATIAEYDEEGDELENVDLREQERLKKNLELKKKKADYNPLDDSETTNILSKYDEEIHGEMKKRFTLGGDGDTELADILDSAPSKAKPQGIDLDIIDGKLGRNDASAVLKLTLVPENVRPSSDYLDMSEIKVKKPKKKKTKSTRQKPVDPDDYLLPDEPAQPAPEEKMDVDTGAMEPKKRKQSEDVNLVDDDDLQFALSMQRRNALKKRKRTRPEDIAKEVKEAADEQDGTPDAPEDGGLVIGEVSEFVAGIKKGDEEEEERPRKKQSTEPPAPTAEDEAEEDVPMQGVDAYLPTQEEHRAEAQEEYIE
ncbi:hypothetical protein IMZ48_05135, partial [Candidatus Bathyarchaeota archaeon]|nr:hypothetical protein [Candidatus Bathyarchaeota archaeon]